MCQNEVMFGDGLLLSDVRIHSRLGIPYLHRVFVECNVHARIANLLVGSVLELWPHAVETSRWGAQFYVSLDRYDDVHFPHVV